MNETQETNQNHSNITILKELSDIKTAQAVMGEKISNLDKTQIEIKSDIKEIKNDFINRREFDETIAGLGVNLIKKDVDSLKEFRWRLAGVTGLAAAAMTFIGQLIIKYLFK